MRISGEIRHYNCCCAWVWSMYVNTTHDTPLLIEIWTAFDGGRLKFFCSFIFLNIFILRKSELNWFDLNFSLVYCSSTKSHNEIDDDDLSDSVPDEAFYYQEIEVEADPNTNSPNPPSPPTLSHRDMARPPHEDPEYQRQLVGNMR